MYLLINYNSCQGNCMSVNNFGPIAIYDPYKSDDTLCKNNTGVKKSQPSKVELYLIVNALNRWVTTRSDIRIWPRLSVLNINTILDMLYVASSCFESLAGVINLLSAIISCYKFMKLRRLIKEHNTHKYLSFCLLFCQ